MIKQEEWTSFLSGRVPEQSIAYCYELWRENPFHFVVSKSRTSKLGDFTYRRNRSVQKITVNHDLNPYQFLITYIHEVAHHRVYAKYGSTRMPHGIEWKREFQRLMEPMLVREVFPMDVLVPLRRHMSNPKASAGADLFLMKELMKYDSGERGESEMLLSDLVLGQRFLFKERLFEKLESRRTRVLCEEVGTGRHFLISGHASVEKR
ncbi:transcription elongation protein SprT [Lunatimonas salinarum]|uniref:transcription elongation protein SprT n=1 Tax=Lunatimonas salinarum TaxID=1774590 RepID=UPI001ADECAFD|nr:transcription elongation protein SprT [Lunatimonas salinarum]